MWSTGPVGKVHRAILENGEVVAVADTTEHAARIVRVMNRAKRVSEQLRAIEETKWPSGTRTEF
jgi:hypothetical protein